MAYDPNNIFARILRGEIAAKKVFEDDHVLAFHDVAQLAPIHVLVIPKGPYRTMDEFTAHASDAALASFVRALGKIAQITGVAETGYRLIANCGADAHQEVPHLHMHLVGGRELGPMLRKPKTEG